VALQYFKHVSTGQVYGADKTTTPPVSFFENRLADGKPEFEKTTKPAPKRSAPPAGGAQGDGDQTPKES
jgi:hypothetical protein